MAYELRFDFQIDQQQLDGLSPQEIFILGFEFSTLYHLFNHEPTAFAMFVRAANSARIRAHARQIGRKVQLGPINKGWRKLIVEDAPASSV